VIRHGLVDELGLMINPVVLGGGKSPSPDSGSLRKLRLVERVRDHPAGRYALAMFAEHRRTAVGEASSPSGS
jgi:dihydrofolate reductase